jgi:ubiquinone/menaquinone biosynthesis C-methylase UbiE
MTDDALYNLIGVEYDETRRADESITRRLRAHLAPAENENYLDAGCGTGNYTSALAGENYRFYGVDPSATMLEKARRRSGANVIWQKARAEDLPFENDFFAGALATLTIHHWKDLEKAFGEIDRVLKPGGKFVVFTSFPEQMRGYWLNHYFPATMRASIAQMPARETIEAALKSAGLKIKATENYFVRDDLADHFLYCGKHRPALYLNEAIRRGISSFSALADKREIETGLAELAGDIETKKIARIIEDYENDSGDYVFIVAGKD